MSAKCSERRKMRQCAAAAAAVAACRPLSLTSAIASAFGRWPLRWPASFLCRWRLLGAPPLARGAHERDDACALT